MHSALPQVNSELAKGKGRGDGWRSSKRARTTGKGVGGVVGVAALIWLLYVLGGWVWGERVYYRGGVWNGAETIEVSSSPIIVPAISQIAEYRTSQYVTAKDGRTVSSPRHSVVYGGGESPELVLVMGIDDSFPPEYLEAVIADRKAYAERHGYGLYVRYLKDFATLSPQGDSYNFDFSKVMLLREAAFAFKHAKWLWWLDQDAIIMNHAYSVARELLDPAQLNDKMLRDAPVIPPESIIHTYKRVPAGQIKFVLTQNDRGVSAASFLLRNDQMYGNVFLNYWCDPLHRSYPGFVAQGPFGRLEASLTHMVQWHPAILSRMAVVPHKYLGARLEDGNVLKGQKYENGDFVLLVRPPNEEQAPPSNQIADEWNKQKAKRDNP
ncbi:hypothetical protein TRICI_003628 [Trichomonascus ciferrii]|uniref:Uncharacterized protein n=1 Tax=Trichomonascus ciferrii TaxID=44093 RepID=A0A642V2L7_9ASCO|nr:hypothetical protein TRICI_003628 [Trichomonascus ciferrii]